MGASIRQLHPHPASTRERYQKIKDIDGRHPFQQQAPLAYVPYRVRERKGGKVVYFNFGLAREMGLITSDHADQLNETLRKTLLDAFAIQIVNEYDIQKGRVLNAKDLKPNHYMATRYLQLQHPNRTGVTSGDGRSIWNGIVKNRGKTWDITSRGTGATCLSPATAIHQKFFRTGDPQVSYGCGYSTISEGVIDVLFSESLIRNDVATERILCILEFANGSAITVRAGLNLLRPSHFFNHLKQGRLDRLKNVADYFINRQISNKIWTSPPKGMSRYRYMLQQITKTFASLAAQYEAFYIFCWLDWDGDNILADGGIVDFGSVRQFGLFHHEYRFDDDARWSTNIKEQRIKARYIVQNFAQIVDYIETGTKKPLKSFVDHPSLKEFDRIFRDEKDRYLLFNVGLPDEMADYLLKERRSLVKKFSKIHGYFERAKSDKGPVKVPDGVNWHAIYSMRELMRNLPHLMQKRHVRAIDPQEFYQLMASSFAPKYKKVPGKLARKIDLFQKLFCSLVERCANKQGKSFFDALSAIEQRSRTINHSHRLTGDAIVHIAETIAFKRNQLTSAQLYRLTQIFSGKQQLLPESKKQLDDVSVANKSMKNLLKAADRYLGEYREGL